MPRLTGVSFTRDELRYDLDIEFDDEAIMDATLAFEVTARVTNPEGQSEEASLRLELDMDNQIGRILHEDDVWHTFMFNAAEAIQDNEGAEQPPGLVGDVQNDGGGDALSEFVEAGIGSHVEALLEAMPAGDPIFGCLLKAGVSSTLGQALICNEQTRQLNVATIVERLRRILGCMGDRAGKIVTRAMWRTFRCMARLGF